MFQGAGKAREFVLIVRILAPTNRRTPLRTLASPFRCLVSSTKYARRADEDVVDVAAARVYIVDDLPTSSRQTSQHPRGSTLSLCTPPPPLHVMGRRVDEREHEHERRAETEADVELHGERLNRKPNETAIPNTSVAPSGNTHQIRLRRARLRSRKR